MDDISLEIRQLSPSDRVRSLKLTETAHVPLRIFFRRHAKASGEANITKTYVAVTVEDDPQVAGYISLMLGEIAISGQYSISDKPSADTYDYQPAVRVARLAVGDGWRKKGIGEKLVRMAIGICLESICPIVGCRFIILEAKSGAKGFYERLGFRRLEGTKNEDLVYFFDLHKIEPIES